LKFLHQGLSFSSIAQQLNRSVSTISREVKRNAASKGYQAQRAEHGCRKRHRCKAKRIVFDKDMKDFIKEQLLFRRLSPELISWYGKKCRKDFVSAEWIYQWIWQMKFSQKRSDHAYSHLYEYLRHACRKRKRGNKKRMRGNILERRWIEQRPQRAEQRKGKGHLECDIMLGRDRKPGLLVVLDRKTRKTWIRHLRSKDSRYVIQKLKGIVQSCSAKTITFDNDQSFALHYRLNIPTFFTHPYSAQEKGSVENRIGLIRLFFPKQTDFSQVSAAKVRQVESWINNRPLRMFGYKTPDELYYI
jgi:IS30 family transposase